MYWLDTSPAIETAPAIGRSLNRSPAGAPSSSPGVTRTPSCTSASWSGPNGRRRRAGKPSIVTGSWPSAANAVRNREVVPASAACDIGVPDPARIADAAHPHASGVGNDDGTHRGETRQHRRRVVAVGHVASARSCPAPARRTPAPGWRSIFEPGTATTASTGRSSGRSRRALTIARAIRRAGPSDERCHSGLEPAAPSDRRGTDRWRRRRRARRRHRGCPRRMWTTSKLAMLTPSSAASMNTSAAAPGRSGIGMRTSASSLGCVDRGSAGWCAASRRPGERVVQGAAIVVARRPRASRRGRRSARRAPARIAGAVLGADVEPDRRVPAGDAGHVAEAAGCQAQQRGVLLGSVGGERPSASPRRGAARG